MKLGGTGILKEHTSILQSYRNYDSIGGSLLKYGSGD